MPGGCCPKGPLNQHHGTAGENTTNLWAPALGTSPSSVRSLLALLIPASDKAIRVRCLARSHTASMMQSQDLTPALPDTKPNAFPPKPSRVSLPLGWGLGLLFFGWEDASYCLSPSFQEQQLSNFF